MRSIDGLLDFADIVNTESAQGRVWHVLGDARTGEGFCSGVVAIGPDGYYSRPNETDERGAAIALYAQCGNEKIIIGTLDQRYSDQVGKLEPGDRMIAGKGEQRLLLKESRQSVSLLTTSEHDSKSIMIDLSGEDGEITIICRDTMIKMGEKSLLLAINGGASIELKEGTVAITASDIQLNAPRGNVGAIPLAFPMVAPPAPLRSILGGPSGLAAAPSPTWTVL